VFVAESPGYHDHVVLLDSTPVECRESVETTRRSQVAGACGYGYCRGHSRWFCGCACTCWPPRTAPRAPRSSPPAHQKECEVALRVLAIWPHGAEVIVADV